MSHPRLNVLTFPIFNLAIKYIPKIFEVWFSGRQVFKTVRWSIKAIDENNQLNNITNTSVVEYMPEPLRSVYEYGLYIYPDWDSNYARSGIVLKGFTPEKMVVVTETKGPIIQDLHFSNMFTNNLWCSLGAFSFTILHETIRDKAIIAPLKAAQNSTNSVCKYNISNIQKWEIEESYSQSPEWYALTHSFGERILCPVMHSVFDGNMEAVMRNVFTSASYLAQDITKFRLLAREMKDIIDYLNSNTNCVFNNSSVEYQASDAQKLISGSVHSEEDL